MIPSGLVLPPFLVGFVLLGYQYYRIDSERRIFNLRFALMALNVVLMIAYAVSRHSLSLWLSLTFLAFGLASLGGSIWLLYHMPPPDRR